MNIMIRNHGYQGLGQTIKIPCNFRAPISPADNPKTDNTYAHHVPLSTCCVLGISSFMSAYNYKTDISHKEPFLNTALTTTCLCSADNSGYMGKETIRSATASVIG